MEGQRVGLGTGGGGWDLSAHQEQRWVAHEVYGWVGQAGHGAGSWKSSGGEGRKN